MRAALCRELGPPEHVVVDEIDPPSLGDGQVRVRVHAAALNYPDVLLVAGTYQIPVEPPFVPGSEFAGEVVEIAPGVESVAVGDRVAGTGLVGAFAEEAVVAATSLRPVPDGIALDVAAAAGVAHQTAYHVLRSVAEVGAGDQLVVLGAGGGVGLAAVQLGAELGATVTAVASSEEKLATARELGATHLVTHGDVDLRETLRSVHPEGVDAVVDPVGGALSEPALRSVRWGGRFVTVGFASGDIPRIPLNLVLLKGVHLLGFQFIDFVTHRPDELARNDAELRDLLVRGRAVPHIGATFPLAETAAALRLLADGDAVGKVVLDIT